MRENPWRINIYSGYAHYGKLFVERRKRVDGMQLDWLDAEKMYRSPEVIILSSQDIIELSNWSEEDVDLLFWDSRFPAGELGENKIIEIHALISFFAKKEAVLSRQLAASDAGICKSHNCEMNGEEV